MSDLHLHYFQNQSLRTAVALPFSLDAILADFQSLRRRMLTLVPPEFTRDEWAYLATFLAKENLLGVYERTFGTQAEAGAASMLARPRWPVAVWLPSNVSMLGPLTFLLLALTGAELHLKASSRGGDLTGAFLDYALQHLPDGPLRDYLTARVTTHVFDRGDPRNAGLAAKAAVRIVFGSDAACQAVHSLPHPAESAGISFLDRRSEAWIDPAAVSETELADLVKVFVIFGQAGCTSPARVVLLGGDRDAAIEFRRRLIAVWPSVVRSDVAPHLASRNVRDMQLLRALGWDAVDAPRNSAVLAVGETGLPSGETAAALAITWGDIAEAVATLPENIQTIGYAVADPTSEEYLRVLASTRACRFVRVREMHNFGPVWDGQEFWRQLFEWVSIS
jgi:hypothetical protein